METSFSSFVRHVRGAENPLAGKPMKGPSSPKSVPEAKTTSTQTGRSTRGLILIVDDEEDIVELVKIALARE